MITKLSHVTLFVNNQEEAKNFYVGKLGFEVRTDQTMDGGFRWLTVGPKTQPDLEIVLMEPKVGPDVRRRIGEGRALVAQERRARFRRVRDRRLPEDL